MPRYLLDPLTLRGTPIFSFTDGPTQNLVLLGSGSLFYIPPCFQLPSKPRSQPAHLLTCVLGTYFLCAYCVQGTELDAFMQSRL